MESNKSLTTPAGVRLIKNIGIPFLLIIFIFGLFGNALTVVILRSKRLQQSSTSVYLTVLAVVDIFYLLTGLLATIINHIFLFPNDIKDLSLISCILTPYLSYTLAYLSVWLLVSVTIDRAIWVVHPFSAKRICTTRNAWLTTFSLTLILFAFDSHFFWTMDYNTSLTDSYVNVTHHKCTPKYFTQTIFPYIDLLIVCVIPCLFMLVANGLISVQLKRMRDFHKKRQNNRLYLTVTTPHGGKKSKNVLSTIIQHSRKSNEICTNTEMPTTVDGIQYHKKRCKSNTLKHCVKNSIKGRSNMNRSSSLTAMLLAINMFFMISVCPLLVYDVIFFAFNLNSWIEKDEVIRGVLIFGIERFVYILWYTNFSVHFLLYCLSGPQFRAQVKHWFNSCCRFISSPYLADELPSIKVADSTKIHQICESNLQHRVTQYKDFTNNLPASTQQYEEVTQDQLQQS
ncbi:unnamed protein product [Trichobilharzia szidati]|nr:unnamed protein product [Trichobilharzia szidati]